MNGVIFLGPAGSGKGTQAQYLRDHLNYAHLSTGDMLRDEVGSGSDLGNQVKAVIDAGDLVSDDIIIQIIKKNVIIQSESRKTGLIFDGFPRTLGQAKALNLLMDDLELSIASVVYFDLSLEESINRISGRQIDSRNNHVYHRVSNPASPEVEPFLVTRKDDLPEKVTHRYHVYLDQTALLLDFYRHQLVHIDCLNSIDDIRQQIQQLLASVQCSG
jgi:adenylate kinase